MKNKTLLLVAAAVAGYFLWKKYQIAGAVDAKIASAVADSPFAGTLDKISSFIHGGEPGQVGDPGSGTTP